MQKSGNGSQKTVLVIDDEPNILAYLESLLQDHGFTTITASNGKQGMEQAKANTPDLICLDISMPEQSGIRFYRDLKDDPSLAVIPVFVVTAVTGKGGDPEPFRQFISSRKQIPPPDGFFPKPIDRESFLEAVSKALS